MVNLVSASVTDKGLSNKRPVNEDSFLVLAEKGLFAVADGVGGAQAGDMASSTAMEVLKEAFSHPRTDDLDTEELLEMAIQRANESIFELSNELPQLDMMATTIVTLHIEGDIATIGHVGDSRLYRLDPQGNLFRQTRDHSLVEEEVRAGRMTAAQAAHHPSRNVISRALGAENIVEVEMQTIKFEAGTSFVLCSDGITRHVEDHEMREILLRYESLEAVCDEFKRVCFERGAEDNLTAVVVRVEATNAPAFAEDEDESTVATPRQPQVYAPTSSNGMSGAASTETRAAEFASMSVFSPDASTAPLEEIVDEHDTANPLPPAPNFAPAAPSRVESVSQTKADNDRLRNKVNEAAPSPNYAAEPPRSGSGFLGKAILSLLLLVVGIAIGAGAYFAFNEFYLKPQAAATIPIDKPIAGEKNDFSPQEVAEFRDFERSRRTADSKPADYAAKHAGTDTAVGLYLRGRALMQTGKYEEARASLSEAKKHLTDGDVASQKTLRADIVFALAALNAIEPTKFVGDKQPLLDLVKDNEPGTATGGTNSNIR